MNNIGVNEVIDHLKSELGLNFVAFDFDRTILQIHTGGFWEDSHETLAKHVRPEMQSLIPPLVNDNTIHVAVVTFSSQPEMVRQVIKSMVLNQGGQSSRVAVPIRAEDGSWQTPSATHRNERWWDQKRDTDDTSDEDDLEGKQPHMVSAIQELERVVDGLKITKSTSVLIDDDENNIQIAREHGVRAIWLDPDHPERLFQDLYNLL